jgi:hypothetical protein
MRLGRTKFVACGAASNALGHITDVKAVCAAARDVGALSFIDAVHYAPHHLIDVSDIGCDFLACSPYKFFGRVLFFVFVYNQLPISRHLSSESSSSRDFICIGHQVAVASGPALLMFARGLWALPDTLLVAGPHTVA